MAKNGQTASAPRLSILLLVLQYPPDITSTGQLYAQLAEALASRGHDVTVITTFPHYQEFRVWDAYRGKLFDAEIRHGVRVRRTWSFTNGRKTMTSRLLNYLSYNLAALLIGVCERRSFDVILAPSGSFFVGLTTWLIGLVKRAPSIYNVQDLYPDVPIKMGYLRNRRAISVLRKIERFIYRRSAEISVISPSFKYELTQRGVPPEKISVIPNFVDIRSIKQVERNNDFSREHGLSEKFVVCYSGNIGYSYDLDTLLMAAENLKQQPDITFLIIGDGVMKTDLLKTATLKSLSNVQFLPFQAPDQVVLIRATSDVQVCPLHKEAASSSLPSKVIEIMASGRPVVAAADRGSDLWNLIHATKCGFCVEPGDASAFVEAIWRLYQDPELCSEMGKAGRQVVQEEYSLEKAIDAYEGLLTAAATRTC